MPKRLFTYPISKKGFTLVEILVVIGIITILSALVITALNPSQLRKAARDTNRKKDLSLISGALEQFYADNNAYPDATTFVCLTRILSGVDNNCNSSDTPPANLTRYLKVVPMTQSLVTTEYCYSRPDGQNYNACVPIEADVTSAVKVGGTSSSVVCTPTAPTGITGAVGVGFGYYCIQDPY